MRPNYHISNTGNPMQDTINSRILTLSSDGVFGYLKVVSMEYDGIGENFYFAGGGNVIVLCSKNRECMNVYSAESRSIIRKVALDPLSG